jgi:predicted RNA-binding Zn ribbon-like protein
LCLDFTNTTGNRGGANPRERLRTYRDLLVFGRRTGILGEDAEETLVRFSREQPDSAARVLTDMIVLRETLYRLFLSALDKRPPAASDLDLLNEEQASAFERRKLVWGSATPEWSFDIASNKLDVLRWSVITSATDLLTSRELALVRKCGECDWLFVDSSKNKRRRWCKKACGDRVRARRYYERKKVKPPKV